MILLNSINKRVTLVSNLYFHNEIKYALDIEHYWCQTENLVNRKLSSANLVPRGTDHPKYFTINCINAVYNSWLCTIKTRHSC